MRVPFSDITQGGIRRVVIDTGWSAESGLAFAEQPEAEITLFLLDEVTVTLKGTLKATIKSECSRCGGSVSFPVDQSFNYTFRLGEDSSLFQKDMECSDEDWDTVYIEEPAIDVKEVLVEQLILSVPEKLLCSEQCRGLCPQCGISLNSGKCSCAEDRSNSPFAVLKHLKK